MRRRISTLIMAAALMASLCPFTVPGFAGVVDTEEIKHIREKISYGKAIYNESEFDAGIAEMEKISRLEPDNRKASELLKMMKNQAALKRKTHEFFTMAQRSALEGNWLEAVENFQKALKLDPKSEIIRDAYHFSREKLVGRKRFSMDFENESLKDILLALGQESGTNIIVPQEMVERVSVHFKEVSLEDALEQILKGTEFDVEVSKDFIRVIPKETTVLVDIFHRDEKIVNQKWDNIAVQDLVEVLAQMMNINIIFDPETSKTGKETVNLFIKEMTLWDTFNLLLKMKDLVAKKYNGSENTLIIMTPKQLLDSAYDRDRKIHRTIKLTNMKPSVFLEIAKKTKGISDRVKLDDVVLLDTKETGLDGETRLNAVMVYDVPENIALLESLASRIDTKRRQCVVSVRLMEVSSQLSRKMGFNLDFNPTGANDTSNDYTIDAKYLQNFKAQMVSVGSARVQTDKLLLSATLDFLDRHDMTKTIASPSIRCMDGEEASINITTTKPVQFAKINTATNAQGDTVIEITYDWKDLNFGVKLNVKPIIHDDNEITMKLNIEKDAPGQRIDGNDQTFRYESTSNSVDTLLRIKDDNTIIMGGLISTQRTVNKQSVPFISKIPIFGKLFERKVVEDPENKEMVIFVNPKIVNEDDVAGRPVVVDDVLGFTGNPGEKAVAKPEMDDFARVVDRIRGRLQTSNQ